MHQSAWNIPELLTKLDDDQLSISAAVEIAFLKEEEQKWFLEAMDYAQATPSLSQAQRIKKLSQSNELTENDLKDILCEIKREDISRVTFKTEQLKKYFPKDYTVEKMKRRQVQRYIRLTELIPELLDMVDSKRLQFTAGVEISYIDKEIQQWICEYIHENGNVKQNQIVILRQELLNGAITQSRLIDILNENAIGRIPKKKVTLSEKKLSQYFPPHYTSAEMEKVIVELLNNWKEQGGAENGF